MRARAFAKCPLAHKNRDLQVNLQSLLSFALQRLSHCPKGLASRRFRADYSMIEATRPEPTVRPPSRLFGVVIVFACRDKIGLSIFAVIVK